MKGDQSHISSFRDTNLLHKYSGQLTGQFPLRNIKPWLNLKVTFKSYLYVKRLFFL